MRLKKDNMLLTGIVLAMLAAYMLVVFSWQSRKMNDIETRCAERRRQLEDDMLKATRVPPMVREIETLKRRYNKDWDRRLPKRIELAGFLKEISSNLAQERLGNQMIQPGDPTRGNLYNRLPIHMKFEGNFLALAGFLNRVDSMTRLTRIEQLTIDPDRGGNGANLAVQLGMNIYFTEQ